MEDGVEVRQLGDILVIRLPLRFALAEHRRDFFAASFEDVGVGKKLPHPAQKSASGLFRL